MYSFAGPADVKGSYEKIRNRLQPILIVIFLVTPWLKIDGKPVLLMDFFNRHFVILGRSFFSHDAPLLFFLVIILVLSIFTITAVFGRLWCGWSCPQTVFLHTVFNRIEKWIMGSYTQRTLFYKSVGGTSKSIKILFLYFVFLLVCWVLAHSFVAYFLGANVVVRYLSDGPALHMRAFTVLMVMTGVLFANFTFFREKLCYYICPYGRFQNALIDTNTLVVFYNSLRGEPRGKRAATTVSEGGDCVSCNRCVAVCPVKIDIRQGFQQECIACAKCIDACNEVMHKVKSQPYLIRYETGDRQKITLKRFRLVLYSGLLFIFVAALIWNINLRSEIDFAISRSAAQPFTVRQEVDQKVIQNQLQLHLKNQTQKVLNVSVELSKENQDQGFKLLSAVSHLTLQPEQDLKTPAFIEINEKSMTEAAKSLKLILETDGIKTVRQIEFVGVQ